MEPSAITGDLWAYRAELAARLVETEAELQRVSAALRALGSGENRTFELLRACVAAEHEVNVRMAFDYLTERGWQPEARGNALNALRTALAHLATRGEVERISRGVYRAAPAASTA